MTECMFCKRVFITYSYKINTELEDGICPCKDLYTLFGELDLPNSDSLQICFLCLCVVRTLNEFKNIMVGALQPDPENELSLILAFEEFKRQVSSVPYKAESDEEIDKLQRCREVVQNDEDDLLMEMYSVNFNQSDDTGFSRGNSPTSKEVETLMNEPKRGRKKRGRKKGWRKPKLSPNSTEDYPKSKKTRSTATSLAASRPSSCGSSILRYDENNRLENKHTRLVNRLREEAAASLAKKEHSETQVLYHCSLNVCAQRCETFDQLLGHVMSEHGVQENDFNDEDYKIKLDEKRKETKIKFDLKYGTHTRNDTQNIYPCMTNCQRSYKTISTLSKHKIHGHKLLAKYWCPECTDARFTSEEDLLLHNDANHSKINSYCVYCSKPLCSKLDLFYHLKSHNYRYPCMYCRKYFYDFESLKKHGKMHDGEKDKIINKTIIERIHIKKSDTESNNHQGEAQFKNIREQTESTSLIDPQEIKTTQMMYGFEISDDQYIIRKSNP